MQPPFPDSPTRHDSVRVPVIWFAAALSIALHALVLFGWLPQFEPIKLDAALSEDPSRTQLTVQIAPERPRAQPQPAQPPSTARIAPPPARRGLPEPPRARPPSPPRAVPFNRPAPYTPAPPDRPAVKPPPAPAPEGDFASLLEQRRRERGESTEPRAALREEIAPPQPQESDEERRRRIVAANLGLDRTPSFGGDPRTGGGIFQITRLNYADAEFVFFGWNKDVKRNTRQRIEVAKGDNPTIEIAVVRRMIAIIREHEKGDFTWVSHRLGREVTLSARPADAAGLEDFLMREFYMAGTR
jgi:hypothetical protein